jgi:ribonuclease HI
MPYYAVANGRTNGIFTTWAECNKMIKDFKYAKFRKFDTMIEAEEFLKNNSNKKIETFIPDYYVYTDGSCHNNGKSISTAGIGIYFGENDERNISKKLDGHHTNNSAELIAIITAYKIIEDDIKNNKKVCIVTDSKYAILCATSYGKKCSINNWNSDIPNKELVKQIYLNNKNIQYKHILAHTDNTDIHSIGNNMADMLANKSL